ncbi:MAG: hypothetical protein M3Q30_14400, partial [Actinomycetota bacterium]|nr:hypothetical protein [Actinomycetota bacterium]
PYSAPTRVSRTSPERTRAHEIGGGLTTHARTRPDTAPNVLAPLPDRDKHDKSTVNALPHTPDTTRQIP